MKAMGILVAVMIMAPSLSLAFKIEAKCPSIEQTAQAFLDAEAAGYRHKGATKCLAPLQKKWGNFFTLNGSTPTEPGATETLLDEKKPFELTGPIRVSTVDKAYRIVGFNARTKDGKVIPERIVLVYFGDDASEAGLGARIKAGCASLAEEPSRYYVKQSCLK